MKWGADDYITKPFRLRELLARVRSVLQRNASAHAPQQIEIGPLRILLAQGARIQARGGGKSEAPRNFACCWRWLSHPGQVLSRDQLLARIWDVDGQFIEDNTLSVSIKRLRERSRTIRRRHGSITTVRGLGYRMEEGQ